MNTMKSLLRFAGVLLTIAMVSVAVSCSKDSDDSENPENLPGGEIIGENTFLGKWELLRFEFAEPADTVFFESGQRVMDFRANGDYQISTTDIGTGVGRYSLDKDYLTLYEPPVLLKEVYTYKFNEDRTEVTLTSYGARTLVSNPVQVYRKIADN